MAKVDRTLEELLGEMRKANAIFEGASDDGGRKAAAMDGQAELARKLSDNDEKREKAALKEQRAKAREAQIEELKRLVADARQPSKAALIGGSQPSLAKVQPHVRPAAGVRPHPTLKESFTKGYEGGSIVEGLMNRAGVGFDGHYDPMLVGQGKASLGSLLDYVSEPSVAKAGFAAWEISSKGADPQKATLGATGATGGYVLPNNLVDRVVKPATQKAVYQQLVTTVNGVAVRGVDMPYRTSAAARATFIDWGTQKTLTDEAYGTYTAYLGTIAIIYDIGKQYARFSAGSAEQDVMDEITRGMVLGENYYIAVGAGTGTIGSGDPTTGVYTALAAGPPTYRTQGVPVATTLLGSFAEQLTKGAEDLAKRSRESQAWVVDATTFWTAIGQGTDTAGFWVSPTGGPTGFTRTASGGIAFWGVPVYFDANLGTNATTKIAIGGEWDTLKLYRGMEFRIDTTDVAGTRWDLNLIGFRGEEEIGFNASTPVAVGAMQLILSAIV